MKITNTIEEKDEHSHIIEILNRNSNLSLLEWILRLNEGLAFHDHHQWESHEICGR